MTKSSELRFKRKDALHSFGRGELLAIYLEIFTPNPNTAPVLETIENRDNEALSS